MGKILIIKDANFQSVAVSKVTPVNPIVITAVFDGSNQVAGKAFDYHDIWIDNPFVVGKTYNISVEFTPMLTSWTPYPGSSAFKIQTTEANSETAIEEIKTIKTSATEQSPADVGNFSVVFTPTQAASKVNLFTQRSNATATPVGIKIAYFEVLSN